jgi:hypothetical protein
MTERNKKVRRGAVLAELVLSVKKTGDSIKRERNSLQEVKTFPKS